MEIFLLGAFLTIVVVGVLLDTHAVSYRSKTKLEEYDIRVPLWLVLLVFAVESVPILNTTAFMLWGLWWGLHAFCKPDYGADRTIFTLRGSNFIGRALLWLWKILNKQL